MFSLEVYSPAVTFKGRKRLNHQESKALKNSVMYALFTKTQSVIS